MDEKKQATLDLTIDKIADMNVSVDEGEKVSTKDMVKAIQNMDGAYGKNVIGASIETFSMADGKTKKGDIFVSTLEEALYTIKKLVEMTIEQINEKKKKKKRKDGKDPASKWKFESVPLKEFNKTMDDVFTSFLLWGVKDAEDDDKKASVSNEKNRLFNVSKSYRRLEAYADWMYDAKDDLTKPELTSDTLKDAHKTWALKASYDKEDHFIWWFDLAGMDLQGLKSVPLEESLRYMVWYSHYVMFDTNARKNGVIMVENLDKIGFFAAFTLIPPKLSAKMDRLTIGVLPVKMKKIYITDAANWFNILLAMMSPFISKKMKSRMVNMKDDYGGIMEALGGAEYMYESFGKSKGGILKKDEVSAKYFS